MKFLFPFHVRLSPAEVFPECPCDVPGIFAQMSGKLGLGFLSSLGWIESLWWKWFLCDSLWMLLFFQGGMDRPMGSWLGDLHPRKLEVDLGQWCFSLPKKTCCHISIFCIYVCTFSTHRGRESVNVVYTQVSTFVVAITCWFLIWLRGDKSLHGSLFMTAPWPTKSMGTGGGCRWPSFKQRGLFGRDECLHLGADVTVYIKYDSHFYSWVAYGCVQIG